jgi:hypothetical protein
VMRRIDFNESFLTMTWTFRLGGNCCNARCRFLVALDYDDR